MSKILIDEATVKLALEALERCVATCFDRYAHEQVMSRPEHFVNQAITAIREALVEQPAQQEPQQPVQEPVAEYIGECNDGSLVQLYDDVKKGAKFYISPPQRKPWVGLTDGEWVNIVNNHAWFGQRPEDVAHEVVKLVEAKLREKNT